MLTTGIAAVLLLVCAAAPCTGDVNIRVLSFNMWNCGQNVNDGKRKIVDLINKSGADIVGIQVGQ